MTFEQKLEKRLARLEARITAQLERIERTYGARVAHLEAEIVRLQREDRRQRHHDRVQDREIEHLEQELKPHHYPATKGISIKPA